MKFTKAEEVIQLIEGRKNRHHGLEHFKRYMASLHNPHHQLKSIHIAGTNGKGSTTNDIRSILQAAGYRVGSFTSPYMITHLDRIRINDVDIEEDSFVSITNTCYDGWVEWDLSMFEIDMCIAVLYFLQKQVDICVFETGLGGRLDATNILHPLVSVITNIGLDHMELLGHTHALIAEEKAGIIKPGIDLITAEEKQDCLAVFQTHCEEAKSEMITLQPIQEEEAHAQGLSFTYGPYAHIKLQGFAHYQLRNAALAIETIRYLNAKGRITVSQEQLYQGIYDAVWLGRFETISRNPLIILDGAHNAHGIHALCENLKQMPDVQILFSVLKDKNFEAMIQELEAVSDTIMVVPFQNERALDVSIFQGRPHVQLMDSYQKAIAQAIKQDRPLVITGSLYFISEVRKYLMERKDAQ